MQNTLIITLLFALAVVALMMLGLGVKMLFRKHGEFKRHCSSMDPYTGRSAGCVCHRAANVKCKEEGHYSPLEVNENLLSAKGRPGEAEDALRENLALTRQCIAAIRQAVARLKGA